MVSLVFSKRAERDLAKLPENARERILSHTDRLPEDPVKPRAGMDIRPYRGAEPPVYRLRVGDYRVIYVVEDDVVDVVRIVHRSELR